MLGQLATLILALQVTLVIHVPLQLNSGTPVPATTLARYRSAFQALGKATDHPGEGSWRPHAGARLVFDPDDHVFIETGLTQARAFLKVFLPRMRADLHQDATLGEIFGGWYGTVAQRGERVDVRFPLTCNCSQRLHAVHAIFAQAGGASEYADLDGIHVYTSVSPAKAPAIEAALRHAGLMPAITPSTVVLDAGR